MTLMVSFDSWCFMLWRTFGREMSKESWFVWTKDVYEYLKTKHKPEYSSKMLFLNHYNFRHHFEIGAVSRMHFYELSTEMSTIRNESKHSGRKGKKSNNIRLKFLKFLILSHLVVEQHVLQRTVKDFSK